MFCFVALCVLPPWNTWCCNAPQCWWVPKRTKHLSTVAILLYRFLSCLVSQNVFHVVSASQSIVYFNIFCFYGWLECLTQKDTEMLVHVFVTSKLDNCNSLLAELPQYLLDKVQRVQNAAARLGSCTRKYDQITPVLKELHWLPVKQRIMLKILLFTHKALKAVASQYIFPSTLLVWI